MTEFMPPAIVSVLLINSINSRYVCTIDQYQDQRGMKIRKTICL
jgi:hypothetical protein